MLSCADGTLTSHLECLSGQQRSCEPAGGWAETSVPSRYRACPELHDASWLADSLQEATAGSDRIRKVTCPAGAWSWLMEPQPARCLTSRGWRAGFPSAPPGGEGGTRARLESGLCRKGLPRPGALTLESPGDNCCQHLCSPSSPAWEESKLLRLIWKVCTAHSQPLGLT